MQGYRKSSHAVYRCEYHSVWIPNSRYQVLVKEIKARLKEVLTELLNGLILTSWKGAFLIPVKYQNHNHLMTNMSKITYNLLYS